MATLSGLTYDIPGLTFNTPQPGNVTFGDPKSLPALDVNKAFGSGGLTYNSGPVLYNPPATQQPSGGGGGGGGGTNLDPHINPSTGAWDDNYFASHQDVSALQNQQRNEINSGYDSYFGNLNDMLNQGLPGQKTAQEQIANSQYDQGVNNLTTQKNLGLQDLGTQRTNADTQQRKSLQDLTDNIKNLFQSGNTYLGSRGAGDSSAANQYAYALTQMGSKQRGDLTSQYAQIQNDIGGRESRLNEIYSGQVKDLESQKNQQVSQIAQWYASAQNQIRQMQAQGQLSKGQDLAQLSQNALNQAMQQLQMVQQQNASQQSALQQWALNHANDINSLKQNLASVSNTSYSMPGATQLQGIGGGGQQTTPSLWGLGTGNDTQKNNIFGQPR